MIESFCDFFDSITGKIPNGCERCGTYYRALVEKLPYKSVHIELVLPDQTMTPSKDRRRPIGFFAEEKAPK